MAKQFRTRALDENGDIMISGALWIYGVYAVAQTIRTRLMLNKGENWRDASDGTPWIQRILGKVNSTNSLTVKEALIKKRILETEHVISITKWSSSTNLANRSLAITATILTDFGTITITPETDYDAVSEAVNQVLGSIQLWTLAGINYVVQING